MVRGWAGPVKSSEARQTEYKTEESKDAERESETKPLALP